VIERTEHDDVTAWRLSWWRSRVAGYSVYVYLIRGVLIDTGFPAAERDLLRLVHDRKPRGVFVTHEHEDHAGNVQALASLGLPMAMSAPTAVSIRDVARIPPYRRFTWRSMDSLSAPVTEFADVSFTLEPAPGHSPDHHVVWDHETETLFAGDHFLGVKVRIAHAHEDPREHVRSLRALLTRRPRRVFCAHRGLLPHGAALLAAKADWMDEMIGRVETLSAAGRNVEEIRRELLGARTRTHYVSAGEYSPDNFVRAVLRNG